MSEVKKVRQSIMERKKKRGFDKTERVLPKETQQQTGQLLPFVPQDEEKHGYFPIPEEAPVKPHKKEEKQQTGIPSVAVKAVLSGCMFLTIFFVLKTDAAMARKPKQWVSEAMTENFQFAKANAWYLEKFGSPLALMPGKKAAKTANSNQALPVSGNVTETFETNGKGVKIATDKPAEVHAMHDGVVVFAGKNKTTGRTIVVQHADGSKATYGHLSKFDVHLYQYVKEEEPIAKFSPNAKSQTVYFSIEKDKQFIDPVPVIKVDDRS